MLAVRKADCERSLHVSVYCKTGNTDLRKHGYIETEQRYRTKGGNSTLQFRIKSYPINTKG